ncbi:Ankyrin repeat domain-containing protein 34B [Colius striatus]|uniref:Ankyrin repeat domain-containing protein 34B n=1 Tax=Colius striatus TaxID=57412 RepID=A0A091K165_COLST|nr:ankyrin repeat domain-containing protein 34B [Colius striatus]XP_061873640.1 ankyrin repeat domain-containing protein 34B [Colius striatus]XP_061873641.1 ankyrin repeat domain-containing protein 34B [Colius striatus]XP_061873642.1 ankyrin repeat domain-containing protein 34B [Colius striatus]XP_061873643.1 ankyrin repeat domain-containing protein 34B [Colius striatus]KFP30051.1 Ankyrin repeat domain-containing protein 34B [Colius striatus]
MSKTVELLVEGNSLIRAVYQSRLRLTRLLLEGGAYINESNERGETPLMIACRTQHVDSQSVSKTKMVKYLLENKADPNIQDKSGKTALMHACLEKAGPEVVSLLLKSGADPSLQDHSNCSALVYAINAEDKETLKVLLNACRAQGKEVIIITMDKSSSGRQKTKQYLNMPPADLEECHSLSACISPSQIELKTSPSPLSVSNETEKAVFSFKELDHPRSVDNSSQTVPLMRKFSSSKAGSKLVPMQRLQPKPWIKSSPSLFHRSKIATVQELQDITPEEECSFKINSLALSTRPQSIDIKDTAHLLKTFDQTGSRKLSYDEINSQTPYVEEKHNPSRIPMGKDAGLGQLSFTSNLHNIIQKRHLGANDYSSDSQLTANPSPAASEDSKSVTGKKKIISPSHSLLSSPRQVLENMPPITLSRRNRACLERQGSGALLLDHLTQTRPGFLPPLNVNPHPPIPGITFINGVSGVISCGQKHLVPAAPALPRETKNTQTLLRRQSLQTEQIKQLVNF